MSFHRDYWPLVSISLLIIVQPQNQLSLMTQSTDDERQQATFDRDAVNDDREPRLNDLVDFQWKSSVKSANDDMWIMALVLQCFRWNIDEGATFAAFELVRSGYYHGVERGSR